MEHHCKVFLVWDELATHISSQNLCRFKNIASKIIESLTVFWVPIYLFPQKEHSCHLRTMYLLQGQLPSASLMLSSSEIQVPASRFKKYFNILWKEGNRPRFVERTRLWLTTGIWPE